MVFNFLILNYFGWQYITCLKIYINKEVPNAQVGPKMTYYPMVKKIPLSEKQIRRKKSEKNKNISIFNRGEKKNKILFDPLIIFILFFTYFHPHIYFPFHLNQTLLFLLMFFTSSCFYLHFQFPFTLFIFTYSLLPNWR